MHRPLKIIEKLYIIFCSKYFLSFFCLDLLTRESTCTVHVEVEAVHPQKIFKCGFVAVAAAGAMIEIELQDQVLSGLFK